VICKSANDNCRTISTSIAVDALQIMNLIARSCEADFFPLSQHPEKTFKSRTAEQ
jgi:hypothetical protein